MIPCFKACNKCCSKCCKCMDDCCNSCTQCLDSCCSQCCKCLDSCCTSVVECISKIFSRPLSFCTFLSTSITVLPTILMIVALAQSSYPCSESFTKTALLIQGINNCVNFLFMLYLMYRLGSQSSRENTSRNNRGKNMNILEKTLHLILYDFVVLFYIIAFIFFIVWLIISFNAYSNEPSDSLCYENDSGFLMKMLQYNCVSMLLFLILGTVLFLIVLTVMACDEGSCICCDGQNCCILCCTYSCSCCCFEYNNKEKKDVYSSEDQQNNNPYNNDRQNQRDQAVNRVEAAAQHRQNYGQNRNAWIDTSKKILFGLGLILLASGQSNQSRNNNNNNNTNNRNNNNNRQVALPSSSNEPIMMNPYQPQQQQQQQQQRQQPNPYEMQQPQQPIMYAQQQGFVQQQGYNYQQHQQQPLAPPPAPNEDIPQTIIFNPNQNQNPFPGQSIEPIQQQQPKKGFFSKAKEGATALKNKLFKK